MIDFVQFQRGKLLSLVNYNQPRLKTEFSNCQQACNPNRTGCKHSRCPQLCCNIKSRCFPLHGITEIKYFLVLRELHVNYLDPQAFIEQTFLKLITRTTTMSNSAILWVNSNINWHNKLYFVVHCKEPWANIIKHNPIKSVFINVLWNII